MVEGIGHKISDVSEKSGGNATSEDAISAQGGAAGNRSPNKVPLNNPNPLKASFSSGANKVQSNIESE
jgi:hypothetical protein